MPEMHLRQGGFTYSACGPFTKNTEQEIQDKFTKKKQTKPVFNMIWLILIKYFMINHFNIAKSQKYDGYQHGLASVGYKVLIKRLLVVPSYVQIKVKLWQTSVLRT